VPHNLQGSGSDSGNNYPASGSFNGQRRRSIYLAARRNFPSQFSEVFDRPTSQHTFGRRDVSSVPSQALTLLNDPMVLEQAQAWTASAMLAELKTSASRMDSIFLQAFSRQPASDETATFQALLESADTEADDSIDAGIRNYELAAKLQTSVSQLLDLQQESATTLESYGLDHAFEDTWTYGRQCLLARRLIERGVRFVTATLPRVQQDGRWDSHGNLVDNQTQRALTVDQPIAALLGDLKERGLLESKLVVFATEFGRTPFSQGADGRDHNPFGFSVWLAGAGIRGGTVYGQTDEFGYKAIENRLLIHDFHATILHLLGIVHTELTYRHSGRDYRLTDVHGRVVSDILA